MAEEFNFNQLKMELYEDRLYVTRKWISNYGKLSQYADYEAYINCIKEAFNMVEIVMGNTIYNYRNKIRYVERVSLGHRNGRERFGYRYNGVKDLIDYSLAVSFFGKVKILRQLNFPIPENLDDVRVLRNMTTHNTHTMVGTVADQALSYENVLRSMEMLGTTLHKIGLLRAEDILPEYEKMRVKPGDTVGYSGEYQVGDFIAEGGMSRVYLGLHTRLNRPVAIKELKPYTYRPEQIQNEKQFLVSIENSQIPQIFDIFNQNGTYYIVMEYIDGVGLGRYVEENQPDVDERMAIAVQVCKVLRYIHNECNMVYADLKPDNIMIERTGRVCLIDFGISETAEPGVNAGAYSWFYSSPEQMNGYYIDKRSDVYSLGSLLQFLFAYNNDSGGISYMEELGDYREEVQGLCEICKREDPNDRFQTVEQVEDHIRRIKNDILNQPKAKKRNIRRAILIGIFSLLFLALVSGIVAYSIRFENGYMEPFGENVVATDDGLEIEFSLANRSDTEFDETYILNADIYLTINYQKQKGDKQLTKSMQVELSIPCKLDRTVKPGQILHGQKYEISWDALRSVITTEGKIELPELNRQNVTIGEIPGTKTKISITFLQ